MYIIVRDRSRQRKNGSTKTIKKIEERYREILREIKSQYLEVLLEDPLLPKELLPDGWKGEKLGKEIRRLG